MDRLIEGLIEKGMGRLMEESGDAMAQEDEVYLEDRRDEERLRRRYEGLELTREQRMVIDDYVACALTASRRYAELSYVCGIKDAVRMLVSLGLIKGAGAEG